MSESLNITFTAKQLWAGAVAMLLSLWASWKYFLGTKIRQLDVLQDSVNRIEATINNHIETVDEVKDSIDALRKDFSQTISILNARIDKLWEVK